MRRTLAGIGHYRHFPADIADHAVRIARCGLLGESLAAFPPLAAPASPLRPDGAKLGAQPRRTAAGEILRIQYDDGLVPVFVLAVSRKIVDRRSIGRILFLCGGLDVAAARFMSEGRLKIVFRRPSLIMALPVPFCIGNVNFR